MTTTSLELEPQAVGTTGEPGPGGSTHLSGDPLVLGLPLISVGAVALGLQLVGYVNVKSSGSPLALILAASGLGLLIATIAATRLEVTPISTPWSRGRSLPTALLGVLATFFISYGVLILGLVHGWFGVLPANVQHTVASFQISWLVVFALFAIASTRLPLLFTVLFITFAVVLVLLLVNTLSTSSSTTTSTIAGVLALIIGAAAGYVFLAIASAASGGLEYPIGKPIAQ